MRIVKRLVKGAGTALAPEGILIFEFGPARNRRSVQLFRRRPA
jgi:hypothetical protein